MYLLRHGQSFFNLHFSASHVDPGIEDPELTPAGIAQAQAAALTLADKPLSRIIISPYTRALQTAQPVLKGHPRAHVEVMHGVRERAKFVCDIGTAPKVLAQRYPEHDFAHVPEQWWHPTLESLEQVVERAAVFRALMARSPQSASTLLVSHWAFILALTGESVDNGQILEYDPLSAPPGHLDWEP